MTKLCVTKMCVCVAKLCVPSKTKVDVANCNACHAKRRSMSPSATLATENASGCHQVPRLPRETKQVPHLPRETKVDVTKRRACHAKVPRRHAPPRNPKRATRPSPVPEVPRLPHNEGGCHQVPHLPHKTKLGVTKCHAYHAKLCVCDKVVCVCDKVVCVCDKVVCDNLYGSICM